MLLAASPSGETRILREPIEEVFEPGAGKWLRFETVITTKNSNSPLFPLSKAKYVLTKLEALTSPDCRAVSRRWHFPSHRVGHRPLQDQIQIFYLLFCLNTMLSFIHSSMAPAIISWSIMCKYVKRC